MTDRSISPRPDQAPWWPVAAVGALALFALTRPGANHAAPVTGDPTRSPAASGSRGRQADSPLDIPLRGWKDIAWRAYQGIGEDRLLAVAAGVTFYALLAIFPAIAALVSLYGLFADPNHLNDQLQGLSGILPGGAIDIVSEQVKRIASNSSGSLSLALVTSLAISLWSANAGMKAVFDALNVAYREKEKRSFIALNLRSLAFTLGAIGVLLLALAAVVVVPVVFNTVGAGDLMALVLAAVRWPILLALIVAGLSLLYRYGPSRAVAQWRWLSWGSALAAVLWVAVSMLFSLYVSRFGSYNATYGSLGSAVGFMTWMWVSTVVVLIGAEVAGEMEHQTERDTTARGPQPRGSRNAFMADDVGEAAD